MKKMVFTAAVFSLVALSMASCRRVYRCHCTFKGAIKYSKDLGSQTKKDADAMCSAYDTTVAGEKWTCTLY